MSERRLKPGRIGIILGAVVIIAIVVGLFSFGINSETEEQIESTLRDVSKQNAIVLETELTSIQNLLNSIAQELQASSEDKKEAILEILEPFEDVYNFKRVGFIYPDGKAYTTDGYEQNLQFREYFKSAMAGKSSISTAMLDTLGEEELINVFSVPVYKVDGSTVAGVLFAAYRADSFRQMLTIDSFDGEGYSYVADADGNMVAASSRTPLYGVDNLLTALSDYSRENREVVEKMRSDMQKRNSANVKYDYQGERYCYYMPLSMDHADKSWYVLTIVPAETLSNRTAPITRLFNTLILILIAIMVATFGIFAYTYLIHRKELMKLAYEDPLTGGDNYASFTEKLRSGKKVDGYLVALDISEFKIINNTCGVKKGDDVLRNIWDVLERSIDKEKGELAAHVNADQFVMLFVSVSKEQIVERIMKIYNTLKMFSETLNVPRVLAHFGICKIWDGEKLEEVYSQANYAKNLIKDRRNVQYSFYETSDYNQMLKNRELEDDFDRAIENQEFEVWYQPKFSTADVSVVGAEALVRWRKKDGSLVPPGKFIPLFEQNGMIAILDEYVFRTVCKQQKDWEADGKRVLPVSVNISRASLYYTNIIEKYTEILNHYSLPADYVQLEITESAMVDNVEIKNLLEEFRKAGFKMLLDDFGSGYSSLSSLNTLHFDTLKIDKSLVDYIGDYNGEQLLYHTIKLAKSLGINVTAEGVEKKEQVTFLQKLECNDIQGFYFSKPLMVNDYALLLRI